MDREVNIVLHDVVVKLANDLGFDIHRVPAKYFVLCDWYTGNDCVGMFDDNPSGNEDAIKWMKDQKGIE
jgi:hypothetical protein